MTDTQTPGPLYIDFACRPGGPLRQMAARTPTSEQLAVWQLSSERFGQLGADWAKREQALGDLDPEHPDVVAFRAARNKQAAQAMARALKIIGSVLVDEADRTWLEDQLMDGNLDLEGAFRVVTLTVDKLRERNVETAVARTPAKKASRTK